MKQYLDLLRDVRYNGRAKSDRTGVGTRAVFGRQIRMNLSDGFPLLTTKKVFFRGVLAELLWILSGDTNEHTLRDQNVHIWKEWADSETGALGRVYGAQWRDWQSADWNRVANGGRPIGHVKVDQIANLLADLRNNPTSRRHLVIAWHPGELDQMALPPCHCLFQFYCEELTPVERWDLLKEGSAKEALRGCTEHALSAATDTADIPRYRLSCQLYQRSADIFLGVPFNIASYATLTMMIAQVVNMAPGDFVHTFGDLHLYDNHVDQATQQLFREPRPLPRLRLNPDVTDLFAFRMEDFTLEGYDPHPAIKADVAV